MFQGVYVTFFLLLFGMFSFRFIFFHENNKKKFQINNKPPIESQLSVKVLDSGCRMVVTSFIIVDDVGTPEFTPLLVCFVDVDDSVGESLLSIDDVNGIVDLIL